MPAKPMRVESYAKPTQRLSPTMRAFALVLLLHAGLLLLLQSVMQTSIPAKLAEAISAHIIQEFRPAEPPKLAPPAPPVPPKVQTPPPAQTAPAVPFQAPIPLAQAPSAAPAITVAPSHATPPAPTAPAAPQPTTPAKTPVVIPPTPIERTCAKPNYPLASKRLEEEGLVVLRFLIGENGQVLSGKIEKTSGYKRLDAAALAALSLCQFKPATADGKPKQDWSILTYRWELNED